MQKELVLKNYLKTPPNVDELKAIYKENGLVYYYPMEELFNVLTHVIGIIFGFIMLVLMTLAATTPAGYATAILSSFSIMIMYACSTAYHAVSNIKVKSTLRRVDYASINLTVIACGAGSCLLYGNVAGYAIYAVSIALSLLVMVLCLKYFGKFRYLSVVSNFINGALFAVAFILSYKSIPLIAIGFYITGLLLVLIGACLFGVKSKYVHTVFHIFVFLGPMFCMLSNLFQLLGTATII